MDRIGWVWVLSLVATIQFSVAQGSKPPTLIATCGSALIPDGFFIQLRNDLSLHWKLEEDSLVAKMKYEGQAWIGLGATDSDQMVGSRAVVVDHVVGPTGYSLEGKMVSNLFPLRNQAQFLTKEGTAFSQTFNETLVQFKIPLDSGFELYGDRVSTLIFAVGNTNDFGFHRHASVFRVHLATCEPPVAFEQPAKNDNARTAFAIHGIASLLGFGVAIPMGIAAAIFRSTFPSKWMFIHTISNVFAAICGIIAMIAGVIGIVIRADWSPSYRHLSTPHHWTGLCLLLLVCLQIFMGFRRPADDASLNSRENNDSTPVRPTSLRKKWFIFHRISAICIAIFTVYQLHSGLRLFTYQYGANKTASLSLFWVYVLLLCSLIVVMKVRMMVLSASKVSSDSRQVEMSRKAPTQVSDPQIS